MRTLTAVTLAVILTGCAAPGPLLSDALRSQIGLDANDIIRRNGQPDAIYRMPNGNRVIAYRTSQQVSSGSTYHIPYFRYTDTETTTRTAYCQIEYEVGRNGRVVDARSNGPDCPQRL